MSPHHNLTLALNLSSGGWGALGGGEHWGGREHWGVRSRPTGYVGEVWHSVITMITNHSCTPLASFTHNSQQKCEHILMSHTCAHTHTPIYLSSALLSSLFWYSNSLGFGSSHPGSPIIGLTIFRTTVSSSNFSLRM